jgi:hypothetical protein
MREGVGVLVFDTTGGWHWQLRCVFSFVHVLDHAPDYRGVVFGKVDYAFVRFLVVEVD